VKVQLQMILAICSVHCVPKWGNKQAHCAFTVKFGVLLDSLNKDH